MAQERLQKILARAGVSSRRAAEQLITGGRVRVNGVVISELGARADVETDRIDVDGKRIGREEPVYYLIHKPRGMVTTLRDPEDRPSLSELLHEIPERVYPVGRLDFHTSGALILTNDGDLAQALLHPSKAVPKTYVVKISREVDDWMINTLRNGVKLDDGYVTAPARVEHLRDEDGKSWLQITITEGKNRQIHRMIEAMDTRVMRLSRISFAGISTEDLRPGNIRPLYPEEVARLKREYQETLKPAEKKRAVASGESEEAPARRTLGENIQRKYSEREQRGRVQAADRRAAKPVEKSAPARGTKRAPATKRR
jgi:23S rRNA pseudouridine2605 synthase